MTDAFMPVYIALSVVFLGILAYVFYLTIRQRRVEKELKLLEARLERK
jgi:CcmD family protein